MRCPSPWTELFRYLLIISQCGRQHWLAVTFQWSFPAPYCLTLVKEIATHSSILARRIPTDRGAWRAMVQGVTKSQTGLSNLSTAKQNTQDPWNVNSWGCLLAYTGNISLTCPQDDEYVKEHSDFWWRILSPGFFPGVEYWRWVVLISLLVNNIKVTI